MGDRRTRGGGIGVSGRSPKRCVSSCNVGIGVERALTRTCQINRSQQEIERRTSQPRSGNLARAVTIF